MVQFDKTKNIELTWQEAEDVVRQIAEAMAEGKEVYGLNKSWEMS